jgi:hypothetical protein
MASQLRLQKTAARLLTRDAGLLTNANEASLTASSVAAAVRCRNYASTSRGSDASYIAQRHANESSTLIPHGSASHSISSTTSLRALSTSATSSMHASSQSQSQSTASTSSSSGSVTGSATLAKPSPTTRGILGGIAKVMGYDTTTSAAIRTTSDYYDRCSERDEKEGSFWYDGMWPSFYLAVLKRLRRLSIYFSPSDSILYLIWSSGPSQNVAFLNHTKLGCKSPICISGF